MKKLKAIAAAVLALALGAVLLACSSGSQSASSSASSKEQPEATKDASSQASAETEPFWVLIVGDDTRKGTVEINLPQYADGNARSDVIMLARIDPTNYQVTLISVPRDTEAVVDGSRQKINAAYQSHGIQGTIDQVQQLTGVTPKYYMDMSFVQFEKFVNELGGITANVPIDMHLKDIVNGDQIQLSAGTQHLDGPQALVLARVRKLYGGDSIDASRQIQDRQIVQVGIQQVAADPANAAAHAATLVNNCSTNWDVADLAKLVENFSNHAGQITIYSATGPYAGGIDDETQLWLATRDEDTWAQIIAAANAGQDPSSIVPEPEVYAAD